MERNFIEDMLETINKELDQSTTARYMCLDGTVIHTDTGYIADWLNTYADVLRKRYINEHNPTDDSRERPATHGNVVEWYNAVEDELRNIGPQSGFDLRDWQTQSAKHGGHRFDSGHSRQGPPCKGPNDTQFSAAYGSRR